MKYELLKRTAIALFVGSVVSTYAMAEDDTTNTLKSTVSKLATGIQDNLLPAIATNRTDIDKNTSNIKELAVGIKDNILPALEANRTDIDANKAAIGELAKATDEAVTNLGNAVSGLDEDLAGTQDAVAENRKDIDKNTSNIKELAVGIQDNLLPAIAANRTDIDKNTSNIKELAVGIKDNILPALEANRTDIDANKAAIGELAKATDEAVTNLGNAVSGLDEDLAGTQDAVAENRKDIDKNTSNIKELAVGIQDNLLPAIAANRTDIDANKADVETLKNRANGAAAAVNLLAQNIALNKTNIESKADQDYVEGLEQDVKINTSDIKELSEGIRDNILPALEANRTDIDKNASRITDTRKKQVLQNARLDNHSSRIDANKAALETKADKTALEAKADKTALEAKADKTALEAKADKTALEAKADKTALEAKADKTALEAKADKTALEAKADKVYVGSLEQNIRDNSNRIETNKVAVSALRNDINSHAKRLDHLDNRVNKLDKDLKRGLATQAALTGLFQPYTVGKANFTAAVGGYKSQTAVAIGTGYRYNKHVATKAGVAFTQGGAAYNVGVNFEW